MKIIFMNVIKSVVAYFIISSINFGIYILTYPEMMLFQKCSYVFYMGVIVNIIISIVSYWIIGKTMQTTGIKIKDFLSLCIPSIMSITMLFLGLFSNYFMAKYIVWILLSNISCGFLINLCLGELKVCSFIIALLPTMIMFFSQQQNSKNR